MRKIEAERGELTSARSHGLQVVELGFGPSQVSWNPEPEILKTVLIRMEGTTERPVRSVGHLEGATRMGSAGDLETTVALSEASLLCYTWQVSKPSWAPVFFSQRRKRKGRERRGREGWRGEEGGVNRSIFRIGLF